MNPGTAAATRAGEWPSPIGAEVAAAASGSFSWPSVAGDTTWWCRSDPTTSTVGLFRCRGYGEPERVLGPEHSVGNRSLGYGGRPYVVLGRDVVFTRASDQRLYSLPGVAGTDVEPVPLTPPDPDAWASCYADPVPGPAAGEVWCVRERQRAAQGPSDADPAPRTTRELVAVPLDGSAATDDGALRVVASSHHFMSGARVSPDGRRLAWIGWDHPAMPWETTEVMVADLVDGIATSARAVFGGGGVSVPQVEWDGPDALYAMADPDGWWNLHRLDLVTGQATCVLPVDRDCAGAIWRVGPSWFAVTDAGVVLRESAGDQRLMLWHPDAGELVDVAPGWTEFHADLAGSPPGAGDPAVAVVASAATRASTVLRVPLVPGAEPRQVGRGRDWGGLAAYLPVADRRTASGPGGREIHYVYFPPTHPEHPVVEGSPPLLVHAHGGPTSSTSAEPDLEHAFFTSRGFAVASVDYAGSTGYGRDYRDRLRHQWGIVDVEDCVAVAGELAAQGLADPRRTAVRGGSAGGWTTLAALAFTDVFCAGAVYYPISDPATWSHGETHDFESRYVEFLVGVLPADREHYDRVSPLANAHRITRPLVMLQGAVDGICRPDQARRVVTVLEENGVWHRYLEFEGEGHGFRKATSVAASLRAEAELYSLSMGIVVDPEAAG